MLKYMYFPNNLVDAWLKAYCEMITCGIQQEFITSVSSAQVKLGECVTN